MLDIIYLILRSFYRTKKSKNKKIKIRTKIREDNKDQDQKNKDDKENKDNKDQDQKKKRTKTKEKEDKERKTNKTENKKEEKKKKQIKTQWDQRTGYKNLDAINIDEQKVLLKAEKKDQRKVKPKIGKWLEYSITYYYLLFYKLSGTRFYI